MKKILYTFITVLIFLANPVMGLSEEKPADMIVRVCIMDDKNDIQLALKGKYKIYAINSDRILMEGAYLAADVSITKDGFQIGKREVKASGARVKVARDSDIYVNDRRFRGDIDIVRKDNGKLEVINYIALDDYLYGVLYHEVSHQWPMEALKAQAIAARTFALYQAKQNKLQPYDLTSDVYSQVYGGRTSEKWSTTKAVDLTRSEILIYNGEILPAYYHATCGGYTEDAANLWNINLPPLKGVPCNFCTQSPHYKWTKNIPLWILHNQLQEKGYKIGNISSVQILSKDGSGRVDKMEIKDNAGVSIVLTGKEFRQLLGPDELRSTKFDLSVKWGSLVMDGYGWGHGVGMCQWGAFGMSKLGKSAEEILKYYYPGAEITTIDKIKDKL